MIQASTRKYIERTMIATCGHTQLYLTQSLTKKRSDRVCAECAEKEEDARLERNFFQMIADAIRAKDRGQQFYTDGYRLT